MITHRSRSFPPMPCSYRNHHVGAPINDISMIVSPLWIAHGLRERMIAGFFSFPCDMALPIFLWLLMIRFRNCPISIYSSNGSCAFQESLHKLLHLEPHIMDFLHNHVDYEISFSEMMMKSKCHTIMSSAFSSASNGRYYFTCIVIHDRFYNRSLFSVLNTFL